MHWILLVVYLLGYLPTARRYAWGALQHVERPCAGDYMVCVFLGAAMAMMWPVLVPGKMVFNFFSKGGKRSGILKRVFLSIPPDRRKELELEAREKRLSARENELKRMDWDLEKECAILDKKIEQLTRKELS